MAGENSVAMDIFNSHGDHRIYMECELDNRYKKSTPKVANRDGTIGQIRNKCACSAGRIKDIFLSVFPILYWLPRYDVKQNMFADISAGLTVGIVQIPQGMAYALLATLPPIVGMYVSFFPVILYPIFGTSRHLSIGTFAVVSILVSAVLDQRVPESYCGDYTGGITPTTVVKMEASSASNSSVYTYVTGPTDASVDCNDIYESRKVEVAIALSFCVGLIQVLMYLFRLGIVTVFLSESFLSGFVCGAAFHVVTSQIPKFMGIIVPRHSGPMALIYTYIDILKNITSINWGTTVLSLICTVFLLAGKEVNTRFRKRLPLPIPWELGVVIFSTIASYYGHFEDRYSVVVVGEIPTGIVTSVPRWSDITFGLMDALPLAIVAFTVEISLCQMFATKHAYRIDSNQELLALGACNIFGAFFSCFPSACSLSRSVINEEMGGRTQLSGFMSAAVVMTVLLWVGPLFKSLPQAALAVIIIVNIKSLIFMWRNVKPLWAINRLDAVTWIVAWVAVIFLGVGLGLLVGASFALLTVLLRTRSTSGVVIGPVAHSNVYRDVVEYDTLPLRGKIFVFRLAGPLYFANKDRFTHDLISRLGFNPLEELARKRAAEEQDENRRAKNNKSDELPSKPHSNGKSISQMSAGDNGKAPIESESADETDASMTSPQRRLTCAEDDISARYSHVILDMGQCSFMDSDGAKVIRGLYDSLDGLNVRLLLACCNGGVRRSFKALWKDRDASEYVSLQSAVDCAQAEIEDPGARTIAVIESDHEDDDE